MPESTTDQIVRAAADEFARNGFAGARVDAIARRAGVNKATLYYQIGGKDALYGAVMDEVLGTLAQRVEAETSTSDEPAQRVRSFIRALAADPADLALAAPLMMREVADGGRHLPPQALRQMGRIVAAVRAVLDEGRARGAFREVNPFVVHMMVVGTLLFYAAGTPIRERIAAEARSAFAPERFPAPDEAVEQVTELVLAAIEQRR